jgi:DNA-binding CsgD family transcriptional regulator
MEHRRSEARVRAEDANQNQDGGRLGVASNDPQSGEVNRSATATMIRNAGAQGSISEPRVTSWVTWQSALYLFVLGCICVLLAPLTSFWWIVPVSGMVVPIALVMLGRSDLRSKIPDDRKIKERELLEVLVERGELSPTTAAVRTSLTVDEASRMLEELARKGHLSLCVENDIMAYALRDRDGALDNVSTPSATESESNGVARRFGARNQLLEEPLSERELEVLSLLASGRTNSEVAKDLFVSVGTVKSHTGNIYRKLEVTNRTEALARARELNMLR